MVLRAAPASSSQSRTRALGTSPGTSTTRPRLGWSWRTRQLSGTPRSTIFRRSAAFGPVACCTPIDDVGWPGTQVHRGTSGPAFEKTPNSLERGGGSWSASTAGWKFTHPLPAADSSSMRARTTAGSPGSNSISSGSAATAAVLRHRRNAYKGFRNGSLRCLGAQGGGVFFLTYLHRELRRRFGRTLLTVTGFALAVGLVVVVSALSTGLDRSQAKIRDPLESVGTDLM